MTEYCTSKATNTILDVWNVQRIETWNILRWLQVLWMSLDCLFEKRDSNLCHLLNSSFIRKTHIDEDGSWFEVRDSLLQSFFTRYVEGGLGRVWKVEYWSGFGSTELKFICTPKSHNLGIDEANSIFEKLETGVFDLDILRAYEEVWVSQSSWGYHANFIGVDSESSIINEAAPRIVVWVRNKSDDIEQLKIELRE